MAERLGPPPKKADERFDNWVFRLWKRAFGALGSGDVGVTAPIVITTSGTGTLNIGHGTSGVTSGTYGSASVIPQVVVDTYGHVTSVGTNAVAISGTSVTGTDLTFTSPILGTATNAVLRGGTIAHATSGVIGGTYGALASVPVFAVNTWGHVTLATSSAIAINGTAVTGADITLTSPIEFASGTGTNAVLRAVSIRHSTSGVTPGTYGAADVIPQIVVNTYGHITSVTTNAVTASNLTLGSRAVTTSGTVASYTGFPSTTKRVTVIFDQFSMSGTSNLLVQLGDSGGIETNAYISNSGVIGGGVSTSTSGFVLHLNANTGTFAGKMVIDLQNSAANTWVENHLGFYSSSNNSAAGAGVKSLSDTFTQLRMVPTGTDTFDAGSVNVSHET